LDYDCGTVARARHDIVWLHFRDVVHCILVCSALTKEAGKGLKFPSVLENFWESIYKGLECVI